MKTLLTDSEKEYILAMYREFGCLFGENRYIPRRSGRPIWSLSPEDRTEIVESILMLVPGKQVRKKYSVSADTIQQLLTEAGVLPRWEHW